METPLEFFGSLTCLLEGCENKKNHSIIVIIRNLGLTIFSHLECDLLLLLFEKISRELIPPYYPTITTYYNTIINSYPPL
jgi:hypothetical protein